MNLKRSMRHQVALQVLLIAAATAASLATSLIGDVDRGYACLDRGDNAEAKECFKDALKGNPKDAAAYIGLARVEAFGQKAIDYCTKAISLNPNLADAYSLRANAHLFRKDYQLAIDDYTKVINLHPAKLYNETIANQYLLRGNAYELHGQPDKAMADLSTAIRLSSETDRSWAYQQRGQLFANQKKYRESMADFEAAIKLSPQYSGVYSNRAIVELRFQKFKEAVADYTKAIALAPNASAYAYRAKAYIGLGRKELAEKDQRQAEKLGFKSMFDDFFSSSSSSGLTVKDPKDLKGAL